MPRHRGSSGAQLQTGKAHIQLEMGYGGVFPGVAAKSVKFNLRLWGYRDQRPTHTACSLELQGKLASREKVKGFEDAFSLLGHNERN